MMLSSLLGSHAPDILPLSMFSPVTSLPFRCTRHMHALGSMYPSLCVYLRLDLVCIRLSAVTVSMLYFIALYALCIARLPSESKNVHIDGQNTSHEAELNFILVVYIDPAVTRELMFEVESLLSTSTSTSKC